MNALVTEAHRIAAANAVTGGCSQERAVVERVAQALANAEEQAYDAGYRDSLAPVASRA